MASAVIIDDVVIVPKSIVATYYPITKIDEENYGVRIDEILPFRISITNIGIEGYGSTNIPPIGIAIVGINNYIL
jgi:hypothetical protein